MRSLAWLLREGRHKWSKAQGFCFLCYKKSVTSSLPLLQAFPKHRTRIGYWNCGKRTSAISGNVQLELLKACSFHVFSGIEKRISVDFCYHCVYVYICGQTLSQEERKLELLELCQAQAASFRKLWGFLDATYA